MDGMQGTQASDRSRQAAADHFRLVGELEARVNAHDDLLATMDERHRAHDNRYQQLQSQIARLAGISETTLAGLNKVESFRESDRKELTAALLSALTAAPKSNRAGSVIGMVLASVALAVVIVLIVMGRLQ